MQFGSVVRPTNCNVGLHTLRRCFVTFSSHRFSPSLQHETNSTAWPNCCILWVHDPPTSEVILTLLHYCLSLSASLWSISTPSFSRFSSRSTRASLGLELSGGKMRYHDSICPFDQSCLLQTRPSSKGVDCLLRRVEGTFWVLTLTSFSFIRRDRPRIVRTVAVLMTV